MIFICILMIIIIFLMFILFISEKVFVFSFFYKNICDEFINLKGAGKVDFVNTGSTFAFYGIDYEICGVKGLNLALKPQSIEQDFRMLKHYAERYNDGATIFIVVSDLAFAKKKYTDTQTIEKYYKVLNSKEIEKYNPIKSIRAKKIPVLYNWKNFLRFHWDVKRNVEYELKVNENDKEGVDADAYKKCNSWMEEFSLLDLKTAFQAKQFLDEFSYTTDIVSKMISWCKEKGYQPVLVNLPVSAQMKRNFSEEFLDAFYFDNIRQSNKEDVPFIDLQKNEKLSDYLLYIDSCRLNKAGREIITRLLLKEVELIK